MYDDVLEDEAWALRELESTRRKLRELTKAATAVRAKRGALATADLDRPDSTLGDLWRVLDAQGAS